MLRMVKKGTILSLLTGLSLLLVDGLLFSVMAQSVPPAQSNTTSLENVDEMFNRRRRTGARRGGLCLVAPASDMLQASFEVWSDRPLFLWQLENRDLTPERLQVFAATVDQEEYWSVLVNPEQQAALYAGTPLRPGQVYTWTLRFDATHSASTAPNVTFRIMAENQRNQIAMELADLTTQLQATGATPEAIALQRAEYFAERDLWSDALRELYVVKTSSPEIAQNLEAILNQICSSPATSF